MANQSGTGFTNIQRVLGQNQNNQLGDAVESGIENQSNSFNSNLNNTNSSATNDMANSQNTFDTSKSMANSTLQKAQGLQAGGSLSNDDVNNFQGFQKQSYGGPKDFSNAQQLDSQAQQAQQLGNDTQTAGGRQELLKQFVGQGNYSQGQQQLDSMLLGQTGGGQLNKAKQSTAGLQNNLAQTRAAFQGTAQNLANQDQNAITNLNQQVSGVDASGNPIDGAKGYQTIAKNVNDTVSADQAQNRNDFSNYQQQLGSIGAKGQFQLSQPMSNLFGIGDGRNVYGLTGSDLASSLQSNAGNINTAGVSTPEQYAQYQALLKLSGDSSGGIYGNSTPDQVGSYKGITADANRVGTALQSADDKLKADSKPYADQLAQLQSDMVAQKNLITDPNNTNRWYVNGGGYDQSDSYNRFVASQNDKVAADQKSADEAQAQIDALQRFSNVGDTTSGGIGIGGHMNGIRGKGGKP
jgi:hypothetical protein